MTNSIIRFLFPPLCVHCGREGAWLCSPAIDLIKTEPVSLDPLNISGVDQVIVRGSYDCQPLGALVQKLKYHYWTGLTEVMTDVLQPLRNYLPIDTTIIPVPLHGRRLRERGFNQALLISRALCRMTGLPISDTLLRHRYTKPQAQLSAAARTTNIVGAFGRRRVAIWPTSAILVDDVITTGSTIAECASVLRQHGVKHITAVALAKG